MTAEHEERCHMKAFWRVVRGDKTIYVCGRHLHVGADQLSLDCAAMDFPIMALQVCIAEMPGHVCDEGYPEDFDEPQRPRSESMKAMHAELDEARRRLLREWFWELVVDLDQLGYEVDIIDLSDSGDMQAVTVSHRSDFIKIPKMHRPALIAIHNNAPMSPQWLEETEAFIEAARKEQAPC